ncbi:MAG: phosphoribosylformylglycinamidine synthase, partial [Bacteroidales bacterium]|nr:phosphoribosylformylglycinamidine synthase [Bacteroidales bacterium]
MIIFYESPEEVFAVGVNKQLSNEDLDKLYWLFGRAERRDVAVLKGYFRGPRKEMVTPWSTNAVDITLNMGITGLERIEVFRPVSDGEAPFDPMLESLYQDLDQKLFLIDKSPESIRAIDNIAAYNEQEGLALSQEEVQYLQELSER